MYVVVKKNNKQNNNMCLPGERANRVARGAGGYPKFAQGEKHGVTAGKYSAAKIYEGQRQKKRVPHPPRTKWVA
jgi:hypothetical protein